MQSRDFRCSLINFSLRYLLCMSLNAQHLRRRYSIRFHEGPAIFMAGARGPDAKSFSLKNLANE